MLISAGIKENYLVSTLFRFTKYWRNLMSGFMKKFHVIASDFIKGQSMQTPPPKKKKKTNIHTTIAYM